MSEFLQSTEFTAEDEDYSLGDTPPEINGDIPRRPRPVPDVDDTGETVRDIADAGFVADPVQSAVSKKYERKARVPILLLAKRLAAKPNTVADAAAVIEAGPDLARAFGDAAADNAQIRRMVDFVSESTTSPTLALVSGMLALGAQIARNHEADLVPRERQITLRNGRVIPLRKIGFRMNPIVETITNDPEALTSAVFDSQDSKLRSIFSKWRIAR